MLGNVTMGIFGYFISEPGLCSGFATLTCADTNTHSYFYYRENPH